MLKRRSAGRRPQITFTADFHELVQGGLIYGPCVLRYDPHRIVPQGEIAGATTLPRPVKGYINFHPAGGHWEKEMWVPPGRVLERIPDPTGQGTMFDVEFPLPQGCDQ